MGGIPFYSPQLVSVPGLLQITECPFQNLDGFPELFFLHRQRMVPEEPHQGDPCIPDFPCQEPPTQLETFLLPVAFPILALPQQHISLPGSADPGQEFSLGCQKSKADVLFRTGP